MSKNRIVGVLALSAFVALGVGWVTAPIYDVVNAPVVASRPASTDDVEKAIIRAGTQLGRVITPETQASLPGALPFARNWRRSDIRRSA